MLKAAPEQSDFGPLKPGTTDHQPETYAQWPPANLSIAQGPIVSQHSALFPKLSPYVEGHGTPTLLTVASQ